MKKIVSILLIFTMLTVLAGCQQPVQEPETTELSTQLPQLSTTLPDQSARELSFEARYVRTNCLRDGGIFPGVQVVDSLQALNDYYAANRELYDLERKEQTYTDTTVGFLNACDAYDEAFFEENYLIFVLLEEGSGSISHQVYAVEQTQEQKIAVHIDAHIPEVGTCDMAQWHIIVQLPRDGAVPTAHDVQVGVDDVLIYDGAPVIHNQSGMVLDMPPEGILATAEGQATLQMGTCSWTRQKEDGTEETLVADQAGRPLSSKVLQPVFIGSEHAQTVYLPVPGSSEYEPTNMQGYLVKLGWALSPSEIRYTCWPDTVWQDSTTPEEQVYTQGDMTFYARPGNYIYEIQATWEQGRANYYVYIMAGQDHFHEIANDPQIVDDPMNGFCGNTQTTLRVGEETYTFTADQSVTLTGILVNLDYNPNKICKCLAEYGVTTEFGTYGINLKEGYARCEKGQAALTAEQIDQIAEIIEWAQQSARPAYTGQWLDKKTAEKYDHTFGDIVITEIYADCFFATMAIPFPYQIKLNGTLSEDWCVGDQVVCTYENAYYDEKTQRIEVDMLTIEVGTWQPEPGVCYKPVIYLYPEEETDVSVKLSLAGKLTCTYPAYGEGWHVTAAPDGTLTDENGQTYNYLYWEGQTDARWDMTRGFCVKGADTAAFLEKALEKLGLNRREANEFIVFWLPMMEQNPYNIISFQTETYTQAAALDVQPAPDSMIRVFMTWQAAEEYADIPAQELPTPERTGFTVVEWGGTQLP